MEIINLIGEILKALREGIEHLLSKIDKTSGIFSILSTILSLIALVKITKNYQAI